MYRRYVGGRVEGLSIRVEFHREKVPAFVWWAVWDGLDGEIIERETVRLKNDRSVHRYLSTVEGVAVMGFTWQWVQ